jgi:hypothetical protein
MTLSLKHLAGNRNLYSRQFLISLRFKLLQTTLDLGKCQARQLGMKLEIL